MELILHDILKKLEIESPRLGLSYVDEDFGQLEALDNEQDTYPLTFPAVLCELQGTTWSDNDRLQQEGSATIAVRLLIDCYDDTHGLSTQLNKVKEREALNYDLTKILHGMRILDNTASLTRTASSTYNGPHLIKVYETTYTAKIWEKFNEEDKAPVKTISLTGGLKI